MPQLHNLLLFCSFKRREVKEIVDNAICPHCGKYAEIVISIDKGKIEVGGLSCPDCYYTSSDYSEIGIVNKKEPIEPIPKRDPVKANEL